MRRPRSAFCCRLGTRTFTIERRDLLYLLAASTGLRFSEIKSLTPASFDFASDPKTVTVEASYTKRRRRDVQPLRDDIAEAMRSFVEAAPKREPLWPKLPDEIARVMAQDLKAAKIPVTDDAGREGSRYRVPQDAPMGRASARGGRGGRHGEVGRTGHPRRD